MPFQRDPHEPIAHIVRELDELMAAGSKQEAYLDALGVAQAAIERAAAPALASAWRTPDSRPITESDDQAYFACIDTAMAAVSLALRNPVPSAYPRGLLADALDALNTASVNAA